MIKEFFEYPTRSIERGYIIHYQSGEGEPYFPTHAVVEDGSGEMSLIDIANVPYVDFYDFIDAVIERHEGRV